MALGVPPADTGRGWMWGQDGCIFLFRQMREENGHGFQLCFAVSIMRLQYPLGAYVRVYIRTHIHTYTDACPDA